MIATDYPIRRFTRRCAVSGRAIRPGESYYSVIRASGPDLTRIDIASESWTGAPDGATAWWRGKLAAAGAAEAAPNEVLLRVLREPASDPAREDLRHVLALLLLRRKVVRLAPRVNWFEAENESSDEPPMVHYVASDGGDPIVVSATPPAEDRRAELQLQLEALIYGEPLPQEAA